MALITNEILEKLNAAFPDKYISAGTTIDVAIDLLRTECNIMIYNTAPPHVSPISGKIEYGYSVKKCNPNWGWNARQFIGLCPWSDNIWEAKTQALNVALDWLINNKKSKK